jgi:hypothetical protein
MILRYGLQTLAGPVDIMVGFDSDPADILSGFGCLFCGFGDGIIFDGEKFVGRICIQILD